MSQQTGEIKKIVKYDKTDIRAIDNLANELPVHEKPDHHNEEQRNYNLFYLKNFAILMSIISAALILLAVGLFASAAAIAIPSVVAVISMASAIALHFTLKKEQDALDAKNEGYRKIENGRKESFRQRNSTFKDINAEVFKHCEEEYKSAYLNKTEYLQK